jgi:fibronectin type 3 domain-containing protein
MRINKLFGSLLLGVVFFGLTTTAAEAAEITGYRSATVRWSGVVDAESYNIYYKEKYEASYSHSVRDLAKDSREYTIGYLKNQGTYVYKLCAVKGDKTESWCSQTMVLGKGTVVAAAHVAAPTVTTAAAATVVEPKVVTGHDQSTVVWAFNDKAEHFYIFYRKLGEANWTHSVFGLNYGSTQYTIRYLDRVAYEYQVVALDGNYKPIEWSAIGRLNRTPMVW